MKIAAGGYRESTGPDVTFGSLFGTQVISQPPSIPAKLPRRPTKGNIVQFASWFAVAHPKNNCQKSLAKFHSGRFSTCAVEIRPLVDNILCSRPTANLSFNLSTVQIQHYSHLFQTTIFCGEDTSIQLSAVNKNFFLQSHDGLLLFLIPSIFTGSFIHVVFFWLCSNALPKGAARVVLV